MSAVSAPSLSVAPSPSPYSIPAFRRLLLAQVSFGLVYSTFLILPKYFATHAHAGAGIIGWVMASAPIANVIAAPIAPGLIGRIGSRRALLLASLIMALGAVGYVFVDHPGGLAFACRAMEGLAWSIVFAAAGALVAAVAPPGRVSEAIALHGSANLLTNAIAPALAEPAVARFGAPIVFATAAAAAVVGSLLWLRLPDDRAPRASAATPPAAVANTPRFLLLVSAVLGVAFGAVFTFYQPLALARGITRVSDFLVAYTVGALAVRLGFARLIDRVGPRRVAFASFLFYAAVTAAMAGLAPGGLATLGALFGVAHGLFFPSLMGMVATSVPAHGRARVLAQVNACFNGGYVSVALFGVIAEHAGFGLVYIPIGALVALTALGLRRPASERAGAARAA
jgi:MFS family permease